MVSTLTPAARHFLHDGFSSVQTLAPVVITTPAPLTAVVAQFRRAVDDFVEIVIRRGQL